MEEGRRKGEGGRREEWRRGEEGGEREGEKRRGRKHTHIELLVIPVFCLSWWI